MRRNAREAVYKLLFSNQFNDKFDDEFKLYIYSECELTKEDITFANEILDNFYKNEGKILLSIDSYHCMHGAVPIRGHGHA